MSPLCIENYIRESIVQYVQEKFNVKNPKLILQNAAKNGDNFASDVYRVYVIDGRTCDSDDSGLNDEDLQLIQSSTVQLILKTSPQDTFRRQIYHSSRQFNREHYTYTTIFPAFEKFQLHKLQLSEIFTNYPKMLEANMKEGKEFIILNDLCPQQYYTSYRPQALSYTKCLSVIKALAKFHAISFAYKDQYRKDFEKLTSCLDEITFRDGGNELLDPFLYRFIECAMSTLTGSEEDEKVKGRLKQYQDIYANLMRECVQAKDDAVILHGDCWTSNLLFREEAYDVDVKFIDWQGTRYGSPVIDLSYFLFCCTDAKFRVDMPKILKFYYEHLVKRTAELGSDGANFFTYSKLEWHMEKFARFGLGMALLTLHATTCDPDKIPRTKNTLEDAGPAEMDNIINYLISRSAYRERMSDVCRDVVRYGYL